MQFILCSGSTIVGVGSPDPPQFVYDDEEYQDVFLSGMLLVSILQSINSSFKTGRLQFNSVVRQPAPLKHILYNGQASDVYT